MANVSRSSQYAPPTEMWKKKYLKSGNYSYEGWAPRGTATSAASWIICRTTLSAGEAVTEEWATGESNVWDDVETLTYA